MKVYLELGNEQEKVRGGGGEAYYLSGLGLFMGREGK